MSDLQDMDISLSAVSESDLAEAVCDKPGCRIEWSVTMTRLYLAIVFPPLGRYADVLCLIILDIAMQPVEVSGQTHQGTKTSLV